MTALSFEEAREAVFRQLRASPREPHTEMVALLDSAGRVLASDYFADRDYPPMDRSARDGYAVRSADLPGELAIIGEVRAGTSFEGELATGQAVEIMTGAPVPQGADAVVMVEHTERRNGRVAIDKAPGPGDNISRTGCETRNGEIVVRRGTRVGYAEMAMLAAVGCAGVRVFRRPRVAIVATGNELVDITATPRPFEVRNSNEYALSMQVRRTGAEPVMLAVARDEYEDTRLHVERGLESHLLLLSGGVSAGKYDLVRSVLADLGAEFYFDRVRIQPGQPLVFGRCHGRFFFGLPGNPSSTMLCYELFARAAVELISGQAESSLPILFGRLTQPFRQRPGLTRFLPARLDLLGQAVTPVSWSGSADIAALARSNAFLVTDPDRESWEPGEMIRVLAR